MFDFSKYNLGELNAIMDILQYIDEGGRIDYQQEKCREAMEDKMHEMIKLHLCKVMPLGMSVADPPDMFGWVGDALDDLCAAGEVLGSDE